MDRADDFGGGAIALHADGIEREVGVVKTAPKNANYVADGGAGRRSDEADAAWKERERLFSFGGEEALGFEPLLELVEGEL